MMQAEDNGDFLSDDNIRAILTTIESKDLKELRFGVAAEQLNPVHIGERGSYLRKKCSNTRYKLIKRREEDPEAYALRCHNLGVELSPETVQLLADLNQRPSPEKMGPTLRSSDSQFGADDHSVKSEYGNNCGVAFNLHGKCCNDLF